MTGEILTHCDVYFMDIIGSDIYYLYIYVCFIGIESSLIVFGGGGVGTAYSPQKGTYTTPV